MSSFDVSPPLQMTHDREPSPDVLFTPADVAAIAAAFFSPWDVLGHPTMTGTEKRELLASWASDSCAVESSPNWRRLPETGAIVLLDDILAALLALDRGAPN